MKIENLSSLKTHKPQASRSRKVLPNIFVAIAALLGLSVVLAYSNGVSADSIKRLVFGKPAEAGSRRTPVSFSSEPSNLTAPEPLNMTASGSLLTVRSGHTATALAGGRVLITGGDGAGSSEIYDPATGLSVSTGNLNAARSGHTATLLADGRVFITGGTVGGSASATTDIYDPATGTFSIGPSMTSARSGQTATTLSDGRIFIAGGDATGSAEIYDPSANTFSSVAASMSAARSNHSAVLMADGRVLIVGGIGPDSSPVQTGEIFDTAAGTFSAVGNSTADPHVHALLRLLPDGKVQIIGGTDHGDMEIYDPAINQFGAHSHVFPNGDSHPELVQQILDSPTRAALFYYGASTALLDREGHTITEITGSNQALVAGGTDSANNVLNSVSVLNSSPATITTDKLDYAPGTPVVVSGTGFAPNETVTLTFHEDPHPPTENPHTFTVTTDANGNFTDQQYAPEDADEGVAYILAAVGGTSGFTAQTSFHDNKNLAITFAGTGTGSIAIAVASPTPIQNATCTGTPNPCTTAVDNNASGTLTATANAGSTFVGWSSPSFGGGTGNTGTTTCVGTTSPCNFFMGTGGGSAQSITATFTANVATTLTLAAPSPASTVFGATGPVTFSATLIRTSGGTPVSGATVTFTVDGSSVGTAITNASGVASITTYNPSALSVGNHNVQASFAGQVISSVPYMASTSGTQTLTLNKASTTTTVTSDHANPLSWTQISPSGAGPSISICSNGRFTDNSGRLIIYGQPSCTGGGEVRVLDRANGIGGSPSWTNITPASGGPGGRHGQVAVYDSVSNKMIAFGGCAGGCLPVTNDVWVLSNANGQGGTPAWTQLFPTGAPPTARQGGAGAYDPVSNRLIIFGGQNGGGSAGATFGDVWVLTNANGTGGTPSWSQLATAGTFPAGQYGPVAMYDSVNNRLTVIGGAAAGTGVQTNAVNVLTNANGIGGTPTWSNLVPDGTAGAPFPFGYPVTYDASSNRGIIPEQNTPNLYYLNNANGLGGPTSYSHVNVSGGAGTASTGALQFDPSSGRVISWYQSGGLNLSYYLLPASTSVFGQSVTFTANVNVVAPGAGTPSGTVQFFDGATPLGGPQPVSGGSASVSTSSLVVNVHNITATYNGDANFTTSTSASLPHTVTQAATTTSVASSANPSVYGDSVTLTSTTLNGATPVTEGTVTFIEGGTCASPATVLQAAAVLNGSGQVTFTTSSLIAGNHTVTACYSGTNFASGSGNVVQTVNQKSVDPHITANNKEYDTTNTATLSSQTLTGVLAGDTADVTLNVGSANFDTASVGTGKTVTATGLTLSGAKSANYVLSSTAATTTANITSKAITATLTAADKQYNGNTTEPDASMNCSVSGVLAGDTANVTCAATAGSFNSKDVATANQVTATVTISGTAAGNYTLGTAGTNVSSTSATATAHITAVTLTASIINNPTKTYDGTTSATLAPANFQLTGLVGTESFTVTKTSGTYNDANVALATTVSTTLAPSDFTAGAGTLASNYVLPTTASGQGTVLKANAVINVTGFNGTYTGDPHCATGTAVGVEASPADLSSLLHLGACYTNVPGGTANWTFDGNGNYNVASGSVAITIAKADPVISVTPYAVTYDALPHTATGSAVGVKGEALAGLNLSGTTHTNAGTYNGDPWTFTDVTGNYNDKSGTVNDKIDKADAACTLNGTTVTYDGAAHAASGSCTGVGGVDLTGSLNLGSSFTNYPGGTAHWTFTGGTNYNDQSGDVGIVINRANATINVVGYSGTYDGSAHGASGTAVGVLSEDLSSLFNFGATFTNVPGGTANWTFNAGNTNNNYNSAASSVNIVINAKNLTIDGAVANNKVYDGNDTATVNFGAASLNGVIGTDVVTINSGGYSATFASIFVADNIDVTVTGVTLGGAQAGNYTVSQPTGLKANITKLNLTISGAVAQAKVYDGNTDAVVDFTAATLHDPISGDNVSLNASGYSASFATKDVGTAIGVTVTGVTLSGTAADNYTVSQPTGLKADITRRTLTASIINNPTKTYDANTDTLLGPSNFSIANLVGLEHFTVTKTAGTYNSPDVATASTVSTTLDATDFTPDSGTLASNYYLPTSATGAGHITPATPDVSVAGGPFTYNANPHPATVTVTGVVSEAVNGTQTVTYSPPGNATEPVNAGTYGVSVSFTSTNSNYTNAAGSGTIVINKAVASCNILGATVTYDGNPQGASGTCTGVPADPTATGSSLILGSSFTNVPGGTAHWAFTGGNNYTDQSGDVPIVINQAVATIVVTGFSGVYDGNPHGIVSSSATGVNNESLAGLAVDPTTYIDVPGGPVHWAFTNANYTDQSDDASVTITKADAICSVNGYSGIYDGSPHGASGSCTGVGSIVLGGLNLGASFTDVPGGTAHWTFSGGTNYKDQNGDAAIVLSQASSTTTVTCPPSEVYNGSAQTPCNATATGVGDLNVPVPVSHTNNVNVGTANADATYSGDINHTGSSGSATFSITPAPVTATGGSGMFTYDGATHSPSTCSVTGPYTGDLTCTNNPSSVGPDAGTTAIAPNVTGTGLTNFAITPVNGSYTIDKRPATWTTNPASKTYGDGDPAGLTTGSGSGFIAADGVTATYARTAGEVASPPTYHITATLTATPSSKLNNYIITNAGAEFTINKRNATWTTNPNGKIFGASDPVPLTTGSGSNFVLSDGVTATYSRVTGEAVGTYQITATLSPTAALANYNITNSGALFTIGAWTLNGFYQPVGIQNTYNIAIPPMAGITWNSIKGGQTVPLKFNVFAGSLEQTNVSAVAGFSVQEVQCLDVGTFVDNVDFVTTGATELRYTGTPGVDGQFIQNWQTPKTANKCYRTTMTTVDGSILVSFFKTKK